MKDIIHICAQHKVGVISNSHVVFLMRLPYRVLFSINLLVRSCLELYSYIAHWPCLQSLSNNYPLLIIASKLKMQYMANVDGLPTYTITINNLMNYNHPNHIFLLNPKPTNKKLICSTITPYNLYALTSSL